jgi:hypothetical protein
MTSNHFGRKLIKMTDQEINQIIANELGYYNISGWHYQENDIPDFCNDHKAMLDAENWLIKIDEISWNDYYCSFEKGLISSTTRERAENFIKILGK